MGCNSDFFVISDFVTVWNASGSVVGAKIKKAIVYGIGIVQAMCGKIKGVL